MDEDAYYAAAKSRDARFDGVFFGAVTSTGIYCRPSCPAMTPKRANMKFYPTAAAAQNAGFRSCKRCRPDATPGSPAWNIRADVVGRAMRLITDGVVDRVGVPGLATNLRYSERQLNRLLTEEVGASPLTLARAQRVNTARTLLETTTMPVTDVAFAAGFASVRQFNETVKAVTSMTPTQLRNTGSARKPRSVRNGDLQPTLSLRLPYRKPLDAQSLLDFLGMRHVPMVESFIDGVYSRSLRLPHAEAVVAVRVGPAETNFFECDLWLGDLRDVTAGVARCRRMLDLDADPIAIDTALSEHSLLAPLIRSRPGQRMPGTGDPNELAVRVVIGQQVSVAGARTIAGRLVAAYGPALKRPVGGVTRLFPSPASLAQADPADLPMPNSRKRAIHALTYALATESISLDPGSDWDAVDQELLALHGIGPWTVAAIRMRALGDPDVFLASDLGIKHALERLGIVDRSPAELEAVSLRWKPWRSYATHHLWSSLNNPKESS